MEIYFKRAKDAKVFSDRRRLAKEYGELAKKIELRMTFLAAAPNLAAVPHTTPTRRHLLKGNLASCYAVDLNGNYRLVFEVAEEPAPETEDGGIDLTRVRGIRILGVKDYH